MAALGNLGPSLLRYPGGDSANWFDLSTGLLLTNPNPPAPMSDVGAFANSPAFTFSVLAELLGTANAQATIVLNLLTGDMNSQISALQSGAAQAQIAVTKLELGNELFYEGLVGGTQYGQVFPTAQSYANAVASWAPALRSAFPGASLGVPVNMANGDTRENTWNQDLIPALKNLNIQVDALIPHNYQFPPSSFGNSAASEAAALAASGGIPAIFSLVDKGTGNLRNLANSYPGYQIWNTETNLKDLVGGVGGTWTHGLYVVYQLLDLLTVPGIAQGLVHALTDGSTYYATIWNSSGTFPNSSTQYVKDTLSASGNSLQLLFQAARNQTSARQLTFSANPAQTGSNGGSAPSLYGWIFGANASCVALNLSATAYSLTFDDSASFAGAAYTQLSGDPTAYVGTPSNLTALQGTFNPTSGLTLPAYSLTVLTA